MELERNAQANDRQQENVFAELFPSLIAEREPAQLLMTVLNDMAHEEAKQVGLGIPLLILEDKASAAAQALGDQAKNHAGNFINEIRKDPVHVAESVVEAVVSATHTGRVAKAAEERLVRDIARAKDHGLAIMAGVGTVAEGARKDARAAEPLLQDFASVASDLAGPRMSVDQAKRGVQKFVGEAETLAKEPPILRAIRTAGDALVNTKTAKAVVDGNKDVLADVVHKKDPTGSMEAGAKGVAMGLWSDAQNAARGVEELFDLARRSLKNEDWKQTVNQVNDALDLAEGNDLPDSLGDPELTAIVGSSATWKAVDKAAGKVFDDIVAGRNPKASINAGAKEVMNAAPKDMLIGGGIGQSLTRPEVKAAFKSVSEEAKVQARKAVEEARKVVDEVRKDPLAPVAAATDAVNPARNTSKATVDSTKHVIEDVARAKDPTDSVKAGVKEVGNGLVKDANATVDTAKDAAKTVTKVVDNVAATAGNGAAKVYNGTKNVLSKVWQW